jgi:hypothetical protein
VEIDLPAPQTGLGSRADVEPLPGVQVVGEGRGLLRGEAVVDEHQVGLAGTAAGEPVRIQRVFEVETKLLDEDMFGDDEVFLIVEAHCNGERVSGKSNVVVGDF